MFSLKSDPLRRGIRTFFMAWAGTFLSLIAASAVPSALAKGEVPDLNLVFTLGASAAMSAVVALITWGYNAAEDSPNVPIPALLKAPAYGGKDPVPAPKGTPDATRRARPRVRPPRPVPPPSPDA